MTINDLIERLEEYRIEFGGDCEVRLMTQQNWPFENGIVGLTSGSEINDEDVIYIVEGGQIGYGTKRAWDTAR